MPRARPAAPAVPAPLSAVDETLAAFRKVFLSKPPYVSGVYSIDKTGYLLYYGGTGNPRCIDLANASESDLQTLSDACQPATFGRNDVDVYDESYRKAGKMDAGNFATKFDPEGSGLLDLIWPDFLSDGGDTKQRVVCELYKLNVYGQDSFFKAHKDTPRSDTMFGSLVVVFPTPHSGGALILREHDKEWTFDSAAEVLAGDAPKIGYVVFFSDVEHEVARVTSGFRVTLTYNLYFNAKSTTPANALLRQPDLPSRVSQVGRELRATLASLLAREDFLPSGGFLGFGLRFMYPLDMKKPVAVIGDSLKGCDAMIKIVCDELGLPSSLKAMYRSTSDVYDGVRVFVARDTFWKGTGPHQQIDTEVGCPYETYTNKTSIVLRPAGAPPLTDYKGRVKPTEEVKWITEVPKDYNVVKSTYMAYGNEAQIEYAYGRPIIIARVGSFAERNGTAGVTTTGPITATGPTEERDAQEGSGDARAGSGEARAGSEKLGSGPKASEGQGRKDQDQGAKVDGQVANEKAKAGTNAAAAPRGRRLLKQATPAAEDARPAETFNPAAAPGATTNKTTEAGVSAAEDGNSTTEVGSSTADALVTEGDNLAKKKGVKRKATAPTQPTRTSTRLRSQGPAKKQ